MSKAVPMTEVRSKNNSVEPAKEKSDNGGENQSKFSFAWEQLYYTVKAKGGVNKDLVCNAHGMLHPGNTLAIMGPSGCGKTTLLNVLADRIANKKAIKGNILVNGKPRKSEEFRQISSYVAQEDSLLDIFTVRETISFAAALSYPFFMSSDKKKEKVENLAQQMGLESCMDNRVGGNLFKGISGGQKKRLSVALSLISNPFIILLDEPTSGLDSAATLGVMEHVRSIAQEGRTIIYSIHQPSSEVYQTFDNLCLLSSGKTIYYGKADGALNFFGNLNYKCPQYSNPPDYFLTVINTDFEGHGDVDAICDSFANGQQMKQLVDSIESEKKKQEEDNNQKRVDKYHANWIIQFMYLTKRNMINSAINPGIYWVRIVMYLMLCIMMGTMYLRTIDEITYEMLVPLLFYCQAFLVFMAVAVLPFFMLQQPVFVRERSNGLIDVFPFVFSNFVSALPGILLIAAMSSVLVVFMADMNNFWGFFLNLFLSLVCAESLMHVLSASTPHYIIAIALGAGFFGMFMLAEGFMVPKNAIPAWWIWAYYIAFHTYSFESFMYNQFGDEGDTVGAAIIKQYDIDMDDDKFTRDMLILSGYAVGLQIVFFLIVYIFHTGKI